ncbi:uncharacterized protein LOC107808961 [Nicotiana tabacum]|uniref:Uncharacterized protein DDB_G0286299-like n=1 Tax=Nicotiana tabacum TaxID=4097 RepID=A0A1S4BJG3_TOBAC|nr:uncharacterized protein DDB_G0286299-like [Nicotiana tomentosiformis]XP_016489011.1 PREDICTED: uncharacterized protein DDB_G0286299-like [Nicotiana tabacum]
MDPSITHKITSKNPTFCTHKNVLKQQKQKQKKAVGMDKLKEAILKLSNSEPNGPLSPTLNSILQQRLSHFLSSLYTTPDHPPYSWMIQRALQELDERGGSSEDSISEFIKKEYDNLPMAHMFLLKHHLQKLSENGEILMIDGGGRFLLAGGGNNSLNPKTKSKKKYKKRKGRWGWEIKQKKRRRKEKEKKHDDVKVIKEEKKKLDEQQNEVKHGQQNGMHRELNGHHNQPNTDKEEGLLSERQNGVAGKQLIEFSKMKESHEIVLATVEPSTEKKQQLEEGTSTPEKLNEDDDSTGFEAVSIEMSSQTDREQRQLKSWSRDRSEPKSVSASKVEPLPLCASTGKHLVQMEEPLALATSEEALNLTDPQHNVHSEQPKSQLRRRPPKYKEDEAKLGTSTVSALATNEEVLPDKRTNEEVLCSNHPRHEVHFKKQIQKRCGRTPKGNDDGAKPGTTVLKKLGLSKNSKKKQNGRSLGRPRKTQ